jgi:hypothetical protein
MNVDTINEMLANTGVTASLVNVGGHDYLKFCGANATRWGIKGWGVETGHWPLFAASAAHLDEATLDGCALVAMNMALSGLIYDDIGAIFDPMAHFEALYLGSVETSPNEWDYHFSGEVGRCQKLSIHTVAPDYFIASRLNGTTWKDERETLEQAVCPDWGSVERFFGDSPLAKRLFKEVSPDDRAAADELDEPPPCSSPSTTMNP